MGKYKLVNNKEFDLKGVYYGGLNQKYCDLFDITTEDCAKIYTDIEEAKKAKEMLAKCFGYTEFEIETVKEIVGVDNG